MGYYTTVLIKNDAFDAIEKDPTFLSRLLKEMKASESRDANPLEENKPVSLAVGSFANYVTVVGTNHSSEDVIMEFGDEIKFSKKKRK